MKLTVTAKKVNGKWSFVDDKGNILASGLSKSHAISLKRELEKSGIKVN